METKKQDDFFIYQDRGLAKNAKLVHGKNPVLLIEKILRERIFDSVYWKLNCFGIDILGFIEQASKLKVIQGSSIDNNIPSHFQCLLLKLLQIQPPLEIIKEFLNQRFFKYLTCLTLFYVRLTFKSKEVYEILEDFYKDYRKIRYKEFDKLKLCHVDEFVDDLLNKNRICDMILPRLIDRQVLEDSGELEPRLSDLQIDESEESEVDENEL